MPSFRPRTLPEYTQLIWRRKWLFLMVFAAVLLATVVVVRRIPNQYQSQASIVITSQEDRAATAARVMTITQKIYSRDFLEPLINLHSLYPAEVGRGDMEAAVSRIRKDIKVEAKYRGDFPESLTVDYRNSNPETAQAVASDLVAAFGNMNQAIEGRMDEQSNQISTEIAELETRLNQLGQQRAVALAHSHVAGQSRSSFDMQRAQRMAAESTAETLADKQYALKQQIAETQRQIGEQEKLVKAAPRDVKSGSSYGVLLVRKAELEAQLKDFQAQYTDKNPKVVQAQTQIAELNRQIAALSEGGEQTGAAPDSSEARELRSLQRELSNQQAELSVVERELGRKQQQLGSTPSAPPSSAPVVASTPIGDISNETNTTRLSDRYTYLVRRQDELRQMRGAMAGLDPGIFQIVDRPAVPQTPAGPNRLKLEMVGLFVGLGLALLVTIAAQAPRLFEIRDDRDVDHYLGAPVIGLIPESLTPSERGRQRMSILARRALLMLMGIALIPGLILLLNQIGIFQLLANRW